MQVFEVYGPRLDVTVIAVAELVLTHGPLLAGRSKRPKRMTCGIVRRHNICPLFTIREGADPSRQSLSVDDFRFVFSKESPRLSGRPGRYPQFSQPHTTCSLEPL